MQDPALQPQQQQNCKQEDSKLGQQQPAQQRSTSEMEMMAAEELMKVAYFISVVCEKKFFILSKVG